MATLVSETCCECGIEFAMPSDFQQRRRNDHAMFYCPSGHPQHYTGQSEAERLRRELEQERQKSQQLQESCDYANQRTERERRRRYAVKGQVTKLKKRISNGVCPCCNRHFKNLFAHMKGQHPKFVAHPE